MNPLLFSVLVALQPNSMPEPSYKAERIALYVTAAADIITTRVALHKGSYEGNALLAKLVGRKPSTLKLVAVKAGSIALTEWARRFYVKRGQSDTARFLYWWSVLLWGYASGWNLQWAWK
jgi:hypothetical protein